MNQMRAKSSNREPTTAPRTEPAMTPARWEWDDDDSPLIGEVDLIEDEGDEGNEERVVGAVAGEVVRVEDGDDNDDDDEDDDEVEGSADAEVGVAIVEKDKTDPELVGRVVGRSDDDSAGEDEPPKTQTLSVPRGI
jgi:hypothetical protein